MKEYSSDKIKKYAYSWSNDNTCSRFDNSIEMACRKNDAETLIIIVLKLCEIIETDCSFSIMESCDKAIRKCIKKLLELDSTSEKVKCLIENENDTIRRYLSYYVDDCSMFLNDDNDRIRKVATIRSNFDYLWNNGFSDNEKDAVNFINDQLERGEILIIDKSDTLEEMMHARIYGSFIKDGYSDFTNVDRDVFKYLDRRILSCFVSKYTIIGDYNLDIPFDKVLESKQKTI